ncbi:hypothetical protein Bhyg_14847 [Pseudolycoriella hygida]|uniref:Uncharacterized protein n=1 Tax=Pseudolycoriella hygida TaxID=35572 RepID=A0A9Q0MSM8_9DIPT|nr:hypothetical protein Bhyg_14847 [Pseudolycoriella hygida]
MNFPLVFAVILVYLTVACTGQFKILGVLDAKSETINRKVDNIRSLEQSSPKFGELSEFTNATEAAVVSENVDEYKENVNFIQPYESATNELQRNSVESTSDAVVKNETANDKISESEKYSDKEVTSERIFGGGAKIAETSTKSLSTAKPSRATLGPKSYRKSFQPNIRKFAYIEARSFHHPDPVNYFAPSSRQNNYKFIKVLKYRNKYKSKCRCERISNCPKIQISIQRCQPDYFMCCF